MLPSWRLKTGCRVSGWARHQQAQILYVPANAVWLMRFGQCGLADAVWLRVLTDLLSSAVTKINTPLNISSKMALKTVMKMALDAALKTKVN